MAILHGQERRFKILAGPVASAHLYNVWERFCTRYGASLAGWIEPSKVLFSRTDSSFRQFLDSVVELMRLRTTAIDMANRRFGGLPDRINRAIKHYTQSTSEVFGNETVMKEVLAAIPGMIEQIKGQLPDQQRLIADLTLLKGDFEKLLDVAGFPGRLKKDRENIISLLQKRIAFVTDPLCGNEVPSRSKMEGSVTSLLDQALPAVQKAEVRKLAGSEQIYSLVGVCNAMSSFFAGDKSAVALRQFSNVLFERLKASESLEEARTIVVYAARFARLAAASGQEMQLIRGVLQTAKRRLKIRGVRSVKSRGLSFDRRTEPFVVIRSFMRLRNLVGLSLARAIVREKPDVLLLNDEGWVSYAVELRECVALIPHGVRTGFFRGERLKQLTTVRGLIELRRHLSDEIAASHLQDVVAVQARAKLAAALERVGLHSRKGCGVPVIIQLIADTRPLRAKEIKEGGEIDAQVADIVAFLNSLVAKGALQKAQTGEYSRFRAEQLGLNSAELPLLQLVQGSAVAQTNDQPKECRFERVAQEAERIAKRLSIIREKLVFFENESERLWGSSTKETLARGKEQAVIGKSELPKFAPLRKEVGKIVKQCEDLSNTFFTGPQALLSSIRQFWSRVGTHRELDFAVAILDVFATRERLGLQRNIMDLQSESDRFGKLAELCRKQGRGENGSKEKEMLEDALIQDQRAEFFIADRVEQR